MIVHIYGSSILNDKDFHIIFAELFDLPYYGHNLDALWDALTGMIERPVVIVWNDSTISQLSMGAVFFTIIAIFDRVVFQDMKFPEQDRFSYILL
jgi:ribonuclease inhibitor